jgi:hypothetical protein
MTSPWTPELHIKLALGHLEAAVKLLKLEHTDDGYGSKPRALRFAENALLALSQAAGK